MFDIDDQVVTVSPFDGQPTTIDAVVNGIPTTTVIAHPIDPARAVIGAAVFWCVVGLVVFAPAIFGEAVVEARGYTGMVWAVLVTALLGMAFFASPLVIVKFTPTRLAMRRGWFHPTRQVFDLAHPHRISLLMHDKAQQEKLANDYRRDIAARSGTAVKPEVMYGNSFHICFEHFGQRHDIMTVYGRKEALRIVNRLQACLEINKARAGTGGSATRPDQQWKTSPGDLPR